MNEIKIYEDFIKGLDSGEDYGYLLSIHKGMKDISFHEFCKYVFYNWSPSNHIPRLTKIGNIVLSKIYNTWKFDITEENSYILSTGKASLFLSKHLNCPYFYDKSQLVIYGCEPAMEFEIAGRDVKLWIDMFC
jgi:hypothetical protein